MPSSLPARARASAPFAEGWFLSIASNTARSISGLKTSSRLKGAGLALMNTPVAIADATGLSTSGIRRGSRMRQVRRLSPRPPGATSNGRASFPTVLPPDGDDGASDVPTGWQRTDGNDSQRLPERAIGVLSHFRNAALKRGTIGSIGDFEHHFASSRAPGLLVYSSV